MFRRLVHSTEAPYFPFIVFRKQSDFAREETRFGYYSAFTLRNVCTDQKTYSATLPYVHQLELMADYL